MRGRKNFQKLHGVQRVEKGRLHYRSRILQTLHKGISDSGGDEESVKVQVDAGGDGGPGDFCEGLGVEDEQERRDVRIRRDDR